VSSAAGAASAILQDRLGWFKIAFAMIRALIVDDEPLAREKLRSLLATEHDVELVGECGSGEQAVQLIDEECPDLVFLDIQMPEMDGFEVLAAVSPARMPVIVFVTAYDQYALRAFDVHALDYLLKPFDRHRFRDAMARARARLEDAGSAALSREVSRLLEALSSETGRGVARRPERLVIKTGGRVLFQRLDEVDWIEAAGNYARLHIGKTSHLLRETMTQLEERLDPERFLRIHRSAIVNLDRIRQLQPLPSGEYRVTLEDGTELTLSRSYRERVSQLLAEG
jgi:two-component system LytT family response regulator